MRAKTGALIKDIHRALQDIRFREKLQEVDWSNNLRHEPLLLECVSEVQEHETREWTDTEHKHGGAECGARRGEKRKRVCPP